MDITAFQVILDRMNLVQELDDLYQDLVHVYNEPIQNNTVPHSFIKAKMILDILARNRPFIIYSNFLLDYFYSNTTVGLLQQIDVVQILSMIKDEIELWIQICLTYNGPALAPDSYFLNCFRKTRRILQLLHQSRAAKLVWNLTSSLAHFIHHEVSTLVSCVREITWLTMTAYRVQILQAFCVLKIVISLIALCLLIYYVRKFILWMISVFR